MRRTRRQTALPLAALLIASALAGCVDEEIVYRERPIFVEPPQAAAGFVGYTDTTTNLTVCGNCHVGQQNQWEETGHADAWVTLEATGRAQDFCRECHSVNSLGNPVAGQTGGWIGAKEARYHDVQCESCHGPGLAHVRAPDNSGPLAPLAVGTDLTQGCGECHSGAHHPFVEEWENSAHGTLNAYPAGRSGCESCHSGEGALRMFGVKADYLEKEQLAQPNNHVAITCAVCHDPHSNEFEGQVRLPVRNAPLEEHLCAQCHDRRSVPDPNSSHGLEPHAPEGPLLIGEAGHFFPGTNVASGDILTTHGSTANPGLCTTCHVNAVSATDALTGEFVATVGHTFNAIPCATAQNIPIPGQAECDVTADARSFVGCTASGCHGTEAAAAGALRTAATRLQFLADQLHGLLNVVDPNGAAAGGEIDPTNPTFTVAEGAFYNLHLAEFGGDIRGGDAIKTWGTATHNPFMMESLLITSIQEVRRAYNLPATSTVPLTNQLKAPSANLQLIGGR